MSARKQMRLQVLNKPWYEKVSLQDANTVHMENVEGITEMLERRKDKKRPIHIVGIAGSNRHPNNPSHETSNSWLMIRKAMEHLSHMDDVTTHAFNLPSMEIEHCNGCRSSTSSLCRFPCDCWPYDDMQDVYAQLTLADGILFGTPVASLQVGSRLKALIDRLISMDGGRFAPMYNVDGATWKNPESKNAEQRVGMRGDFRYVQRLAGKVCAAFATGKDSGSYDVAMKVLSAMNQRGCFIPPNAVVNWNSPRVHKDTAYDKHDFLKALEPGGYLGDLIDETCHTVVEAAKLIRGNEDLWMKTLVGRT
jgi:multimeric flavodoxin WrbA